MMHLGLKKSQGDNMSEALETLRKEIRNEIYLKAYQKRHVRLTSGRESDFYVDSKQVTLTAAGIYKIAFFILGMIRERGLDIKAVGGPAMGAVPLVGAISALSYQDPFYCPLDMFYVRSERKEHGTGKLVEKPALRSGLSVLVVDDVLTTGGSLLWAAREVCEMGCRVEAFMVIVDRQEGGRENIEKEGFELYSIVTREDLESSENNF